MSYSEDQLQDLLGQAYHLPYGSAQIALVEQVVAHADAAHLAGLAFAARMQATTSYVYGGEPARAIVTFSWCLAEFDQNPTEHQRHLGNLLWHFKYMVSALNRFPEIPLERTYGVLDDMQRRWLDTGHTLHAVYAHRHFVARHLGDVAAAEGYYTKWCTTPRDDLSDCVGCDPSSKASWLARQERDEEAVALAEPVLAGALTCSEQPQGILTNLLLPYVRTGRLDQARDAHRRAYRLHRPNLADLGDVADHIQFCARTGNEARGVEILERHLGWLDRAPSPYAAMAFAAAGALALRLAPGVTVHRPAHGGRAAADVPGDALGAELEELALAIAQRFDARNGTDSISRSTRETLTAEPLVEELALSPTAVKRMPRSAPVMVESIVEQSAPTPVAVPDAAEPDAWLDLLEEASRDERDADAVLAAFDERFPVDALTVVQRARRAVIQGDRCADQGDLAAAETAWRMAEADFAAAGDDERRQRTLSRVGLAMVERDRVDEGLSLLVDATERLLGSGSAKIRCDAAGRLAWCLTMLDRNDEALATLDRVAGDLDEVPPRSAAAHEVQRLTALVNIGRVDEALALTGPATERAREAGVRWILAQAYGAHAACLEQVGRLAEAADQISAAIAVSDDPDRIAHLRFVRGNQLARTARAAEALDDLTEAVAGRTATGDDEGAAAARHWLAMAYLHADRLLDAAEVAEEELAYRVRADGAGPVSAIPARHLLAQIYQRLNQPDEAVAQLDAIGRECARTGNPAGQGRMDQEIADILDQLDRDDTAAQRYRSAAGAFQAAGLALEELYSRRRQARSTFWAHGPETAEPLFDEAAALAASLPETHGSQLAWERAMLDHDAARMLLGARRLDEAAARAHASAEGFRSIDEIGGASDADVLRAEILLTADQPEPAEAAARLALAEVPPGGYTLRIAKALATALERQGRAEQARAVRAEHGVADDG